jgi:cellulose synthase/poly-beta-1,6-N-acetylglucosamine synthase-like glycosyltransferase
MSAVFILSAAAVYFVYDGYLRMLRLLCRWMPTAQVGWGEPQPYPALTVLVTARNEAAVIKGRIDNILACEYPRERLQILIASDGSTDGTDDIVRACTDERVTLFTPVAPGGKSRAQNEALPQATGDVVVFSDAGTTFEAACLLRITEPFRDPAVGGVDGHVQFLTAAGHPVSRNQGRYWDYELRVRAAESTLGWLAVGSGACLAVRRALLTPIPETTGEDCYVPLDVVRQGFRMVHCHEALAFDRMEHEGPIEFRSRVRMTLRNWQGTWMFPELLNPLRHPGYAFALWSHKVLRWLSPVFLILAAVAAGTEAAGGSRVFQGISVAGAAVLAAGLAGWWGDSRRVPIRGAGTIYSFLLANAGFLVGTIRSLFGGTIARFK